MHLKNFAGMDICEVWWNFKVALQMKPSFVALYHRSRYSRLSIAEESQEQRERFAVALVAWGLRHDENEGFRTHFLKSVCRLNGPELNTPFTIEIEPEDWGDLVLIDKTANKSFVIEFKIGAKPQPHQDPFNGDGFWRKRRTPHEKDGYGWQLFNSSLRGEIIYILLTLDRHSGSAADQARSSNGKSIVCRSTTWSALAKDRPPFSGSTEDLLESLGELGVNDFFKSTVPLMKTSEIARNASALHQLLLDVLRKLGLAVDKSYHDCESNFKDGAWCFGLNFRKRGDDRLAKVVLPKEEEPRLFWLGYEGSDAEISKSLKASVYFFCSAEGKQRLKQILADLNPTDGEGNDLIITRTFESSDSKTDSDWFFSVLNKVRTAPL